MTECSPSPNCVANPSRGAQDRFPGPHVGRFGVTYPDFLHVLKPHPFFPAPRPAGMQALVGVNPRPGIHACHSRIRPAELGGMIACGACHQYW